MMTCMRAWTKLNFGLLGPLTAELAALERLEKFPYAYKNDVTTFSRLFLIRSFSYLLVMSTYMRAWMSFKLSQIKPLVSMVTGRVMKGRNRFDTFSWLFFIRSHSYLQVTITCMRAQPSSNFDLIGPPTAELAALGRLKNPHRLIMRKRCLQVRSGTTS